MKKGFYIWSEDLESTGLLDWSQVYIVEYDGATPKLFLKSLYEGRVTFDSSWFGAVNGPDKK